MNHILQIVDLVTAKTTALRLDQSDASMTLADLLDRYLKNCDVESLIKDGRITASHSQTLQDIQDLVFISTDEGYLQSMFTGIAFLQGEAAVELTDVLEAIPATVGDVEVSLIEILIERVNVSYDRNWVGFHKRRWKRGEVQYSAFIRETLEAKKPPAEVAEIVGMGTSETRLKLLRTLAERIWESHFENYTRFVGDKRQYKTGDEALRNIIAGGGGICSEKVQALKFMTDHLGYESQYVLAGADASEAVPEDKLREMLATFDFRYAKRYMRYWQHVALLYTIDGQEVLVDVTNGNIPFLFLTGEEASSILDDKDKQPVGVKMSIVEEDFYYHKVAQDIPEHLYFAMEGWIEDVDLVQVFDNELGLFISSEFFVTALVYRSEAAFEKLKAQYVQACERANVDLEIGINWSMESSMGQEFQRQAPLSAAKILDAEEHLLKRYDECHGEGHKARLLFMKLGTRMASESKPH